MTRSVVVITFFLGVFVLSAAADLRAESPEATAASYVEMGDKFSHQGALKLAIGAYTVAIAFAPEFAPAYFHRALAYQSRNDLSLAIADYNKTIGIVPGCAEAYANRGYVFALQDDGEKAFSDWDAALAINPKLTAVYYNRGNLRLNHGDVEGA